jgi:hypothetical protein
MSKNEERIEIEELKEQIEELFDLNKNLESKLQAFIEPCAIGHEQLWKIVREDIQGLPVPNGINLRDMI